MTPRPSRIDRRAVIEAALAELDEGGLDAFSMRRLGGRLGVDPMAVYRHVANQGALFDAVVEHVWAETAQLVRAGADDRDDVRGASAPTDWRAEAAQLCGALRCVLLRHPATARLVATRPVVTPAQLVLADCTLGRLREGGLGAADAMRLLDCAVAYVVGKVHGELRAPAGGRDQDPEEVWRGIDPATLPHVAAAMGEGYDWAPEEEFRAGLTALLDGWGVRARESTAARG